MRIRVRIKSFIAANRTLWFKYIENTTIQKLSFNKAFLGNGSVIEVRISYISRCKWSE